MFLGHTKPRGEQPHRPSAQRHRQPVGQLGSDIVWHRPISWSRCGLTQQRVQLLGRDEWREPELASFPAQVCGDLQPADVEIAEVLHPGGPLGQVRDVRDPGKDLPA